MDFNEALSIVTMSIVALGGGGAIVLALSAWLGKVWANRLMEQDRSHHQARLEQLRADLTSRNEAELARLRIDLERTARRSIQQETDKTVIYRAAIDMIAEMLGDIELHRFNLLDTTTRKQRYDAFNRQRMKAYGYMAMLAPQEVMDAFDALVDHVILMANEEVAYDWPAIRRLALSLLNEVRKDVGIDSGPVEYRGTS